MKSNYYKMNNLYLETYTSLADYQKSYKLKLPLESYIAFYIFLYCRPSEFQIFFLYTETNDTTAVEINDVSIQFAEKSTIPWQVTFCLYPVVFYEDTVITGLCAVSRHICKYRISEKSTLEYKEGLLGFRKCCLQAPNEVSIWTKFCEVDLLKTVVDLLRLSNLEEMPKNLIRFENHLNKPVRIHNMYKIARQISKENKKIVDKSNIKQSEGENNLHAAPESRTNPDIDKASLQLKDVHLSHQFSEGPLLTLADLVLLPSYCIIVKLFGENKFQSYFPLTYKWFCNLKSIPEIENLRHLTLLEDIKSIIITSDVILPKTEDVSLYKSDPKRHNPKKKMFTKPDDIERALDKVTDGMELQISENGFENEVHWNSIPDGANPFAGHLPDVRIKRKSEQLENLTLAVLKMAKDNDIIVDFCSGSGHLGILIAYLLPKTTVILLENKETSLFRARERVLEMGLKNVSFFQCNLDFFIGKFDIGVALHACGIASDLVLDKCLKANAKFVICPCCYGSLHATDRLIYPRSNIFKNINLDQYLCIGHTADQTHKDHPLTVRGARCMAIIDSDRARLAEEYGYCVTLSKLKPISCTDKNNLLTGVPA